MKKTLLIILIGLTPLLTLAQTELNLKGVTLKDLESVSTDLHMSIPANTEVEVLGYNTIPVGELKVFCAFLEGGGKQIYTDFKNLKDIKFKGSSINQVWEVARIRGNYYEKRSIKWQEDRVKRAELKDEVEEYLDQLRANNLVYKDDYLQDMLYAVALAMAPTIYPKHESKENLSIEVIKNPIADAYMFPDGTLCVTTGLLTTLNTENELKAIMAQQLAHYVLDHPYQNIARANIRENRATFWANAISVAAAFTDIYLQTRYNYWEPYTMYFTGEIGSISLTANLITALSSKAILNRLGITYTINQDKEADRAALNVLEYLKLPKDALASALYKIQQVNILSGDLDITSRYSDAYTERINAITSNITLESADLHFEIMTSSARSYNALLYASKRQFIQAQKLIDLNIKLGTASANDYLTKANLLQKTNSSKETDLEALAIIEQVENSDLPLPFQICKQKAIVLLRLKQDKKAMEAIKNYQAKLDDVFQNMLSISEIEKQFRTEEDQWCSRMLHLLAAVGQE